MRVCVFSTLLYSLAVLCVLAPCLCMYRASIVAVVGAMLSDGDCLMLAQALNLPPSVKLARTQSVDMRLFTRPPRLPPTNVCALFMCAVFF